MEGLYAQPYHFGFKLLRSTLSANIVDTIESLLERLESGGVSHGCTSERFPDLAFAYSSADQSGPLTSDIRTVIT